MIKKIFAWDLGATKCTAGIVTWDPYKDTIHCEKHYTTKVSAARSLESLIENIEQGLDCSLSEADAICIGAAGQFDGETLRLENAYPYEMHFAKVAKARQWPIYTVLHDYAPIVCATFTSYMASSTNVKNLNANVIDPYGRRVALGIGTGLGLKDGVLLPSGDFWLGKNEIGHIGVPTPPEANSIELKRHRDLMHYLEATSKNEANQTITFEKLLSGAGMVRMYQFFNRQVTSITPEEVGEKMRSGAAEEVVNTFAWYTGLLIGTIQLTFMPEGGIWMTGGVALKNLHVFDRDDFQHGIQASPAYRRQREKYPLGIMCNHEHALMGCGYYASRRLLGN